MAYPWFQCIFVKKLWNFYQLKLRLYLISLLIIIEEGRKIVIFTQTKLNNIIYSIEMIIQN